MANTYQSIAKVTVGSGGASNIEFTSIPSTYTDLVVLLSTRTNRSNEVDAISLIVNSDTTAANYTMRTLWGAGGGGIGSQNYNTYNEELAYVPAATATANTFGNTLFYIPNYTVSQYKSISVDSVGATNTSTNARFNISAYIWKSNNAITTLKFVPITGNLLEQHSTATLYGIKSS